LARSERSPFLDPSWENLLLLNLAGSACGFALATGFKQTGLDVWLAGHLSILRHAPPLLMILAVCTLMTFVTEFTSNIASTTIMIPVLAALAQSVEVHPLLLIVPATLSASCAFMMPVATPPNAIVFSSGWIEIKQMARVGFFLNLLGILLVTGLSYAGLHFSNAWSILLFPMLYTCV
jgi:sodium-dependent dicarboxylate transporter 2/3/5